MKNIDTLPKKYINKLTIKKRFEYINMYNSQNFILNYKYILFINNFLLKNYFNNLYYNFQIKTNILLFDLLFLYKGSRHLRGLPVNGQRTWTNAWNAYKTNTTLRSLKLIICKRMYNINNTINYPIIYLSEHINNVWKIQWQKEWKIARKKRLFFLKNTYGLYKVDLYSLSSRSFTNINKLKKKSKKSIGKSSFSLGFDLNFTKSLLKLINNNNSKLKVQILWNQNKK